MDSDLLKRCEKFDVVYWQCCTEKFLFIKLFLNIFILTYVYRKNLTQLMVINKFILITVIPYPVHRKVTVIRINKSWKFETALTRNKQK